MADKFDDQTLETLLRGRKPIDSFKRMPTPKDAPLTLTAGLPSLRMYKDPSLQGSDYGGYVTPRPAPTDDMFLAPDASRETVAHEAEHLLARRQLPHAADINKMFDELTGDGWKGTLLRSQFVQDASRAYPYIKKKYGITSGYFSPDMLDFQAEHGALPNLAFEQMATLASIEAAQGVDLTKDPYLRKNLFKDRKVREVYNALTGLRQTRLDSKDLRPHTRQKEAGSNFFTDLIEGLKVKDFNKGGLVDKPLPGGKKLI